MKTEQEILELAFAMFLEKGFSEVSTNELIRETGLTKGGFYYSFKSREDLDHRVIEKYIRPYFALPVAQMQKAWEEKEADTPTEVLLWKCFFLPQRFREYQKEIGKEIPFRDFYFLLYEGMKKFPEVAAYHRTYNTQKGELLQRILKRGQLRGEVKKGLELDSVLTMILAMQDGILALKMLDDSIDEEEKYRKIQDQMWKDISTEEIREYLDGGVKSAVS